MQVSRSNAPKQDTINNMTTEHRPLVETSPGDYGRWADHLDADVDLVLEAETGEGSTVARLTINFSKIARREGIPDGHVSIELSYGDLRNLLSRVEEIVEPLDVALVSRSF